MKLKHKVLSTIAATAIVCSAWITPALAQDAVLRASTPNAEINLRAGASTTSTVVGYGVVGDRVRILSEARGSDGFTWYQVRFYNSGETGWIRGDFISAVANNPNTSPEQTALARCREQVERQLRSRAQRVVIDSRDRNGNYRVNWVSSNAAGFCRVNSQGTITAFEIEDDDSIGGPTDDDDDDNIADLEERRRELQGLLEDNLLGLRREQAIQLLRQQGYNPVDNGRGTLSFTADRGIYPVSISYNRSGLIEQIQVLNRDDIGNLPTPDPNTDNRRRQLETDISELIVKLYNDEALPILRRRGYAATDNGRGTISFQAERGLYTVTATYNSRTLLVERVQVTTGTSNNTPGETVVSFQTPTYTVRVFRQNDRLLMNVFNKRTQRQELNGVAAIATRTSQGTTYSNETGNLGYYARTGRNNRFRLDVYSNSGQVAGEDSI